MDEFRSLLLDGCDHLGMAVAGRCHGNAGGEVQKLVAIHVLHANAASASGHQRIRPGVARRNQTVIGLNGGLGFRSRQRRHQLRPVLGMHFLLGHFSLLDGCAAGLARTEGSKATGPGKGPFNVPGSDEPACRRGSSAVLELVAAEEARSSAGGQHSQVPPRADAARTRARPAPLRRKDSSAEIVPLHANPAWVQDTTPVSTLAIKALHPEGLSAGPPIHSEKFVSTLSDSPSSCDNTGIAVNLPRTCCTMVPLTLWIDWPHLTGLVRESPTGRSLGRTAPASNSPWLDRSSSWLAPTRTCKSAASSFSALMPTTPTSCSSP